MATKKPIVIEMPEVDPKKHSVKFAPDGDAPVKSIYVENDAVKKLGAEEGIKITIEAL